MHSVNLLPMDQVKDKNTRKLTKNKDLFQLQQISSDSYSLSPFTLITFTGHLNSFLAENGITLCYVVDDTETELKDLAGIYIKTYDMQEDGTYKIRTIGESEKKFVKGI